MQVNKKILAVIAASMIGVVSFIGLATAQPGSGATLSEKIAQRFNLNKDDVQKVIDEDRSAKQADREKRYEERLSQAVKDGKLTEDQKNKILAKHKELVSEMDAKRDILREEREQFESKTDSERQALMEERRKEMESIRSEIEKWEKENNIPAGYLHHGPKGGAGGHKPGRF